MKLRSKLLIFLSSLALSTPAAFSNIYRYDLTTYSLAPGAEDPGGNISGFFVLDMGLVNGDPNFSRTSNGPPIPIPNWITSASLTFTPDNGGTPITRTMTSSVPLTTLDWTISASAASAGGFNPDNDLTQELITLGFSNNFEFKGADLDPFNATPLSQQFGGDEFILGNPVPSTPAPAPLPILGLFSLAWYIRKFKKKSI